MTYNSIKKIRRVMLCVMIFAVFAVEMAQTATGVWNPVPFTIQVSGTVNGVDFSFEGTGTVDPIGTYTATLTFSNIPPNFHAVFVTAWTCSICCYLYAKEVNGGMNLHTLLGDGAWYDTVRTLSFPLTGDELTINGGVTLVDGEAGLIGTITGTTSDPGDLTGESYYQGSLSPKGPGNSESSYDGAYDRLNAGNVPVTVVETLSFSPEFSLPFVQTRRVDETGSLDGLTYSLVLHSVVQGPAVGGIWVPVDKLGLLAPYIGLASTILVVTAATAIYVNRVKRREEKQ